MIRNHINLHSIKKNIHMYNIVVWHCQNFRNKEQGTKPDITTLIYQYLQ